MYGNGPIQSNSFVEHIVSILCTNTTFTNNHSTDTNSSHLKIGSKNIMNFDLKLCSSILKRVCENKLSEEPLILKQESKGLELDPFPQFNKDVIVKIFEMISLQDLTRVSRSCIKWKKIAYEEFSLKEFSNIPISLDDFNLKITYTNPLRVPFLLKTLGQRIANLYAELLTAKGHEKRKESSYFIGYPETFPTNNLLSLFKEKLCSYVVSYSSEGGEFPLIKLSTDNSPEETLAKILSECNIDLNSFHDFASFFPCKTSLYFHLKKQENCIDLKVNGVNHYWWLKEDKAVTKSRLKL